MGQINIKGIVIAYIKKFSGKKDSGSTETAQIFKSPLDRQNVNKMPT